MLPNPCRTPTTTHTLYSMGGSKGRSTDHHPQPVLWERQNTPTALSTTTPPLNSAAGLTIGRPPSPQSIVWQQRGAEKKQRLDRHRPVIVWTPQNALINAVNPAGHLEFAAFVPTEHY
jgi:hypothetical protein